MESEITIVKKSEDHTSIWLSNGRAYIIDSKHLREVKQWREGDVISVTKLPSDSPYSYNIRNGNTSVLAGIPND